LPEKLQSLEALVEAMERDGVGGARLQEIRQDLVELRTGLRIVAAMKEGAFPVSTPLGAAPLGARELERAQEQARQEAREREEQEQKKLERVKAWKLDSERLKVLEKYSP